MLQQQPRLGPSVAPPLLLGLLGPQTAIHLPRADPQQLTLDFPAHPKTPANPRHPLRQQRLQPNRPGRGSFPYLRQDRQRLRTIAVSAPPHNFLRPLPRTRPVQQPNRILAVATRVPAEFVQDRLLLLPVRP